MTSPVNKKPFFIAALPDDLKLNVIKDLTTRDLKSLLIIKELSSFFGKSSTWETIAKHRHIKLIPNNRDVKKQVLDFLTLQPVEGVKYALKSLSPKLSEELSKEFDPKILNEAVNKMIHSPLPLDHRIAENAFINSLQTASTPIDSSIQDSDLLEKATHERDISERAVNIYIDNGFINGDSGLQPWGPMLEAAVGNPVLFDKVLIEVIKALKKSTEDLFDQFSQMTFEPVITKLINEGVSTKEYTGILLQQWPHNLAVQEIKLAIEIGLTQKDPELTQFKVLLANTVPSFMLPYVNSIEAEKLKEFDSDPVKKTQLETQFAKMRDLIAG